MLNADDVRQRALSCLKSHSIPVSNFHSLELIECKDGLSEWVVRFETPLPSDVDAGPELVLVIVNERGDANIFETL